MKVLTRAAVVLVVLLPASTHAQTVTVGTSYAFPNRIFACPSKTLSNTSATAAALVNIAAASNTGGGAEWTATVIATDGTNFDVEQQTCNVGWVNKAGAFTVATPVCTATVAASNTGSTTVGATVTGAASVISLNATPVFTTIVPTTVTAYVVVRNNSGGALTCQ